MEEKGGTLGMNEERGERDTHDWLQEISWERQTTERRIMIRLEEVG